MPSAGLRALRHIVPLQHKSVMQEKTRPPLARRSGQDVPFPPMQRRNSLRTLHGRASRLNPCPELPLFEWATAQDRRARTTLPARWIARRHNLSLSLASLVAELA